MTVSSTTSRNEYNGNAATTAFAYTFRILDQDHIAVYVDDVLKTITTHYTISGVGVDGGGTVTFLTAPPAGTANVVFLRSVPLTQATDYVENDPFPAETHEDALDKLTMISQQLKENIDRAVIVSPTSTLSGLELPAPTAGYSLVWNATEDGLENSVSNTAADSVAAAASAAAALVSQNAAAVSAAAALVSQNAAGVSAAAALVSENNAETAETNASTSASTATTQASNASASAAAALASQTAASSSEINAAGSAAAALVSENAAAVYASVGFNVASSIYDFGSITTAAYVFNSDYGSIV